MGGGAQNTPTNPPTGSSGAPGANGSAYAVFVNFLVQTITLGSKGIKTSQFPAFLGYVVYAALVAFLVVGWIIRFDPTVVVADLALLVLVGVLAVVLLVRGFLRRIVFEILVTLVVVCFLAMVGYTIYRLLNPPPAKPAPISATPGPIPPADPIKAGCMAGSYIDCQNYAGHIFVKCNQFDSACKLLAQCWDDKARALLVIANACKDKANQDSCNFQRQNMKSQLLMDCDTKTLKDY